MAKRLVITEKPSVARDIVRVLGGFDEHEGYWENDQFVVTFAVGHLLELLAPEDLDPKYKRWTLDTLPIIPERFQMKPKPDHVDRLAVIQALLEREDVDGVVNACDAGREGELIFREILDFAGSDKEVERLWLQSMTQNAIRGGFEALKPGSLYHGLRDAAYCRTHADWLIGMNATRALTRRLKTRSESQAWSAGRVQTPTLAMLVEREFGILAHKPEAYWRIIGQFEAVGSKYSGTWFDPDFEAPAGPGGEHAKPDRIFDKAKAEAIVAEVTGKPTLVSETRKPSREAPPPLFDLTSLQREANRRFGWSARRTLNAAQRCYEGHKVLTYPRTDTKVLPEDYVPVVDEVITALGSDARFAAASRYLAANGRLNEEKIFNDAKVTDHFAIVPTGHLPERELDGDDGRLFDLVVRRFLGAFHPPAVWSKVERITKVDEVHFRTRARILQTPGWRGVLAETEASEDQVVLPPLMPGSDEVDGVDGRSEAYEISEEETKPPARITEGRLLGLMEHAGEQVEDEDVAEALKDKGIGTPATRADIIENLIRKGYADRVGKGLRPTVKGVRLIDILRRMHADRLASPSLTGELEQHLQEVERARRTSEAFMGEIREYATEIVDRTRGFEFEDLFPDDEALGACPLCSKPVFERSWFYRCKEPANLEAARKAKAAAKKKKKKTGEKVEEVPEVEDCPFRIWKDKSGRYIDRTTVRELLGDGTTRVLDGFTTRQGRSYRAQLVLENGDVEIKGIVDSASNDDDSSNAIPEYEVDETPLGPCPHCSEGEVVETRSTFICSVGLALLEHLGKDDASLFGVKKRELPEDMPYCQFLLPRTVCRREITREEAKVYITDKRTAQLPDFISRRGRPFGAILFMRDTGRHGFEFPPREGSKKSTSKKAASKTTKKKVTKKKATKKKTAAKKAATKKTATKKVATKKKAATKKKTVTKKKTATKKKTVTKKETAAKSPAAVPVDVTAPAEP